MQITKTEVTPVELKLRQPVLMANLPEINQVTAIFVRLETRDGYNSWGCAVVHPLLTGEKPETAIQVCRNCADIAIDLHPTQIEYSLAMLAPHTKDSPAARCAYDLAFHDLLGLIAGLPLYRIFGGYRNRVQISATIPLATVEDSVAIARDRAQRGFRVLKVKGGCNPEEDVQRIKAIHRALPDFILRLDADEGYSIEQALDVTRSLKSDLEMIEQPTPRDDLVALRELTRNSPVPVLADQSVSNPESALNLAANRIVNGLSVKVATCGGLSPARQVDAIARAAKLITMINCVIEPSLLIAAGLSLSLSSPNVYYSDLDGHFELLNDPTVPGFNFENGWLVATDVPGLGCIVNLS